VIHCLAQIFHKVSYRKRITSYHCADTWICHQFMQTIPSWRGFWLLCHARLDAWRGWRSMLQTLKGEIFIKGSRLQTSSIRPHGPVSTNSERRGRNGNGKRGLGSSFHRLCCATLVLAKAPPPYFHLKSLSLTHPLSLSLALSLSLSLSLYI